MLENVPNCHTWVKVNIPLKENYSSKSESHPVKYYLSKILKVFGLNILKYQM